MCFASPLARGHNEWVLAYLVEGADGSRGRGDAASAAPATHVARGTAPGVTPAAQHSAPPRGGAQAASSSRRRASDVASIAPTRPVALARPAASAHEDSAGVVAWRQRRGSARPAAVVDGGAERGGAGSPGVAIGGAGGDPNSFRPTLTTPAIRRPSIPPARGVARSRVP